MPDGSFLETENCLASQIRLNDLVIYQSRKGYVCHRVLRRRTRAASIEFYLKGDNSLCADGWVASRQIVAKVIRINGKSPGRQRMGNHFFRVYSLAVAGFGALVFHSPISPFAARLKNKVTKRPVFSSLLRWLLLGGLRGREDPEA